MELDIEKIKHIKKMLNLTYREIAEILGMDSRQQAHELIANRRLGAADKYAKVFTAKGFPINPKDLIK